MRIIYIISDPLRHEHNLRGLAFHIIRRARCEQLEGNVVPSDFSGPAKAKNATPKNCAS